MKPIIVTLCGSTRFKQAFEEANYRETMAGKIVLTVGCYKRTLDGAAFTAREKAFLMALHKHKIDMSHEILVLNVGGYIGEDLKEEIAYAHATKKKIRYLET